MKEKKPLFAAIVIGIVLVYLTLPLLATFLYSIAGPWQTTLLPEGWTLQWFADLFQDERFLNAIGRTLFVCMLSVALSLVIMLPTVFIVAIYFPKWEKVLNGLVVLPYAVPGIVAAVGLIKLYSAGPLAISGTVWLLAGAYFVGILPYMYLGIRNSMRTVGALQLIEAAELLGANKLRAFRAVILPNILPGITVSTLLAFSVLFGEFALANLLVGGQYETVQIYLYRRLSESGHLASAVAITYFVFVMIISGVLMKLGKWMFGTPKLG